VPQLAALAERGRASFGRFLDVLENRLIDTPFVAGQAFTIADITAFAAIDTALRVEMTVPQRCPNVLRWQSEIANRPSATA
jgi:glutathione S-transferase